MVSQTAITIALFVIISACSQRLSAPTNASAPVNPSAPTQQNARTKQSGRAKQGYSADLNELKQRFNADKGKVRLLLILAPT